MHHRYTIKGGPAKCTAQRVNVLFLLDYAFQVDFRQTRWAVISFVVLFFAGTGGMLGVSAEAGRGWMLSAVIWFIVMAVLAFVQRAITGM